LFPKILNKLIRELGQYDAMQLANVFKEIVHPKIKWSYAISNLYGFLSFCRYS